MRALAAIAALGACHAAALPRDLPPAAPPPALARYDMDVTLVPETSELRVAGTIALPAGPPQPSVTLALMDIMTDVEIATAPASTAAPPTAPDPGAGNARRSFAFAAPASAPTIRFSYKATAATRFVYHIGSDAMLAGGPTSAWYPQLSPTKAVGTIRFHYPARYRIIAGGSARDTVAGDARTTTVVYTRPSTFSFIAGTFVERRRDGAIPFRAYLLRDRPGLDAYVDGCARVLDVLAREFGPYPYDGFAIVEAPASATAPAGFSGASFEGFMVADSQSLDGPFGLAYYGHEIGHQWWGNLVATRGDVGNMVMSEGLAQYGSLRAVEEIEGAAAAEDYRRRGYPRYSPQQSGVGYLMDAAAGLDQPLTTPEHGYSPQTHQLANSKGLLALDHLSRAIGRDRFRAALHDITRRFAFGELAWSDLVDVIRAHAPGDPGPLFAEWFDRAGAPDLAVEWTRRGAAISGAIVQRGAPYHLDVELALAGPHGRASHRIALSGPRTAFSFTAPFEVTTVELDPHFEVLHWTPAYRAEAEAFAPATRALAQLRGGELDDAEASLATAGPLPDPDPHGAQFMREMVAGRIARARGKLDDAKAHLLAALAAPSRPADFTPWAYYFLAVIAADQHDTAAVDRYARAAASADAAGGRTAVAAALAAALASHAK